MDQTTQRHYPIRETDAIDERHPVDLIEPTDRHDRISDLAEHLGRLLRWQLDGGTIAKVGARTLVLVWLLRPDLLATLPGVRRGETPSLATIARAAGVTRAAVNAWSVELREVYGLHSPHGRPDGHRELRRRQELSRVR